MSFFAKTFVTQDSDSTSAGAAAGRALREAFSVEPVKAIVVYASVTHDQGAVLRALHQEVGTDVPILGCSVQGVVSGGAVHEGGYMLGVIGLGGTSLKVAAALEREIATDTTEKGARLASSVVSRLGETPKVCIVLYDPLCHADVEQMIAGLSDRVGCPVMGGGAGQPFGPIVKTFQFWQGEVLEHAAIALALGGPLSTHLGVCHGTSPTGVVMTVTRSDRNALIEIDGRPALDVWREVTGCQDDEVTNQEYVSNWAIGIERTLTEPNGEQRSLYFVRAAFGFDLEKGSVVVQAAIPEGSKIMLHHRTVSAVTEGTMAMGRDMAARLRGHRPWAVLGFECGARTSPFLGEAGTLKENTQLQHIVAPGTPWLGMMAWGEIAPVAGTPAFHNYTYPLLVLAS